MSNRSSSAPQKSPLPSWKLLLLSAIAGTAIVGALLFGGYVVLALWLFSGWGSEANYLGKPLYFDLGEITTHSLNLEGAVIDLRVYSEASGDNGAAAIEVLVDGHMKGKLKSGFNYDLYMNDHPGSYEVMDVDGDGQSDIVIHLRSWLGESYVLHSQDHELYPYDLQYDYPRPW
mgnify:CR=1 FL=1